MNNPIDYPSSPGSASGSGGGEIFLQRFNTSARRASHRVIATYSTSFFLATWVLSPQVRRDIRSLYAVVRIADEIVDGTAAAAGYDHNAIRALLDDYEAQVMAAKHRTFHTDPVLHAYGDAARRCDFRDEHIAAFFPIDAQRYQPQQP